jgi:hypothetical protein
MKTILKMLLGGILKRAEEEARRRDKFEVNRVVTITFGGVKWVVNIVFERDTPNTKEK